MKLLHIAASSYTSGNDFGLTNQKLRML